VHHLSDFTQDGNARALRDLALFAGCSPEQLERVAGLTTIREVSPGRTLCRQGAPGAEFFVVVEGEATVTIDGKDVGTMGPGCGFGEIALLLPEGRRTATVTAATAMTLVVLSRVEFLTLFDAAPTVARRILQDSAIRLARDARSRRIVASP
jgi:CRP/FNR family transcriptional regulator, cyclic AMP receptor protein